MWPQSPAIEEYGKQGNTATPFRDAAVGYQIRMEGQTKPNQKARAGYVYEVQDNSGRYDKQFSSTIHVTRRTNSQNRKPILRFSTNATPKGMRLIIP
jgi:hypothetical protein|tara:strand:+ start:5244 stop:5534 length:291 start_codon:yes stop_codon:yes gene_type:complete